MDLRLLTFNYWIEAAREDLASHSAYRSPAVRASILVRAEACVRLALRAANAMGCADRKALSLRILNWLRADLARCCPLPIAA